MAAHEHARRGRRGGRPALARALPLRRQAGAAARGARARERAAPASASRSSTPPPARWPTSGAPPATSSTRTSTRATCACCGSCGPPASPTRTSRPAGARRWAAGGACWSRSSRAGREELEIELPLSPRALATLVGNLFEGIEIELLAGVPAQDAPHAEVLDSDRRADRARRVQALILPTASDGFGGRAGSHLT